MTSSVIFRSVNSLTNEVVDIEHHLSSDELAALQPSVEEVITQYANAIQSRLDTFAQTRNYDGILSACTYVTSTVPKFAAEGQYCVEARDATWASAYEILNDVTAGNRPAPSLEELFAELPALEWPL